MKIRKVLRELKDATCVRVALVDHGANRIPFRVVKRDHTQQTGADTMDIAGLFTARIRKNEPQPKTQPEIAALVFAAKPSDAEMPRLKGVVEKAGFKTTDPVENTDGSFMFRQSEFDDKNEVDVRLVALAPNLGMVVKGFAPWSDTLGDFDDVMKATSFYSGLGNACNALSNTISQKMSNASDPAEAADGVGTVLKSFAKYVAALVESLPVAAFKFEKAHSEFQTVLKTERETALKTEKAAAELRETARKAAQVKPADMDQAKWDAMGADERETACKAATPVVDVTKTPDGAVVPGAVVTPPAAGTLDVDALVAAVSKSVSASITNDLATLTNGVAAVQATVTAQDAKIAAITEAQSTVQKKLGMTVIGDVPGDNNPSKERTTTTKGDGPFGGRWDTAHAPTYKRDAVAKQ